MPELPLVNNKTASSVPPFFDTPSNDAIFFGDLMSDYHAAESVGCDFIGIGERLDFDEIEKTSSNNYAFIKNFEELLY